MATGDDNDQNPNHTSTQNRSIHTVKFSPFGFRRRQLPLASSHAVNHFRPTKFLKIFSDSRLSVFLSRDIDTAFRLGIRDMSHRPTPLGSPLYSLHFNFLAQRGAHDWMFIRRRPPPAVRRSLENWAFLVGCLHFVAKHRFAK